MFFEPVECHKGKVFEIDDAVAVDVPCDNSLTNRFAKI